MPLEFCPSCGSKRLPGLRYCGSCGWDLEAPRVDPAAGAQEVGDPQGLPEPPPSPPGPVVPPVGRRSPLASRGVVGAVALVIVLVGAVVIVPRILNRHSAEIAFVAKASTDATTQVYLVDPDTGGTRVLTSFVGGGTAGAGEVAFSPNGTILALTARTSADGALQLFFIDPNGSGLRQITSLSAGQSIYDLLWSPDGSRLVFNLNAADGSADIALIKLPSNELVTLVAAPAGSNGFRYPSAWSPDSRRIAYVDSSPQQSSWLMNADGSGVTSIGSAGWADPVWSPDGTRFLFDSGPAIEMSAVDGSNGKVVATLPGPTGTTAFVPLWSPDGRRIAVSGSPFSGSTITSAYVLAADGSGLTTLAGAAGSVLSPVWSPDGRFVAYFAFDSGTSGSGRLFVAGGDGSGAHAVSGDVWTAGFVYPSWQP